MPYAKPYLTEFCNLHFEWKSTNKGIDTVTEKEQNHFNELREKAIFQSGLTFHELMLISQSRMHKTIQELNAYERKLELVKG